MERSAVLDAKALPALLREFRAGGRTVVGPIARDDAIVLDEITDVDQLPFGLGVDADAGSYRLVPRADSAVFAHSAGPGSWKSFLHPPRERLFTTDPDLSDVRPADTPFPRLAFLGVRPCDLAAIGVLDRVLTHSARHAEVLVVAVNCTEPGGACFCTSMGGGPRATGGFDLALTELVDERGHRFLIEVGSEAGARILAAVPNRPASDAELAATDARLRDAAGRMGRHMPDVDLRTLLAENRESPVWDEVASRCLACGNCTMVCPTCFCTTTEDVTDLRGEDAERVQRWDTCFSPDFSYIHGGAVRTSTASRYRHWITHKLSTWYDQFGTSGCVGCGRCVVWCPVGIDITEEASRLAAGDPPQPVGVGGDRR